MPFTFTVLASPPYEVTLIGQSFLLDLERFKLVSQPPVREGLEGQLIWL
jgi:hypothetical protein